MQRDPQIEALLNEVLTGELTSVNQYFLDARMLAHWGFDELAERFYAESIDEMKDADKLIKRILYLDGHPNLQRLGALRTGENAMEKLELAVGLEVEAIARLNAGIALCVERNDVGTRELLAEILVGEEEHLDWLQTQLAAIQQVGLQLYLAQQLRD